MKLRPLVLALVVGAAAALAEDGSSNATSASQKAQVVSKTPTHGAATSRSLFIFQAWGIIQGLLNGAGDGTPVEPNEEPAQPVPSTADFAPIRINCGGGAYTDSKGREWGEDAYHSGGINRQNLFNSVFSSSSDIQLYQTYRSIFRIFGEPMSYNIPVPNGAYIVLMHFADFSDGILSDLRRFNVKFEDVYVFDSKNITDAPGDPTTRSVTITTDVVVYDEELTISFDAISRNPFISAIEVFGADAPMPTDTPTKSPIVEEPQTDAPVAAPTPVSSSPTKAPVIDSCFPDKYLGQCLRAGDCLQKYPSADGCSFSQGGVCYCGAQVCGCMGQEPATEAPAAAPATDAPMVIPTTEAPTSAPVTVPTTEAPTRAPVTYPTTEAPTTASPTNSPSVPPVASTASPSQTAPTPTDSPTSGGPFRTIFINCGGDEHTDFLDNVWQADAYFTGGTTYSDESRDVINTQVDQVYWSERNGEGGFSYEIPVPLGDYEIVIHLAEIWSPFDGPGRRVFDITVEGDSALNNIDPVQQAGAAWTAITVETVKLVSDGFVSLSFIPKQGSEGGAKVSGIEIKEVAPHLAHALAGGPYNAVDTNGDSEATVSVDGSSSHTHGQGLDLTEYIWRSGATILGTGERAELLLPVGENTPLTLTVKDSGGNENTETTTVSVFSSSFPTIENLSDVSGPMGGGEQITITGSGFSAATSETTVHFGLVDLTGNSIEVESDTTIKVTAPNVALATPVLVTVETPVGTSNAKTYTYISGATISFPTNGRVMHVNFPTVVTFGPDRRLYVGTAKGRLFKITFQDGTLKIAQWTEVFAASTDLVVDGEKKARSIMGIAFDPMDTSDDPNVYFSSSIFFHGDWKSSSGNAISGKISMASGPALETITDIITGLPVSDHDHAINGLVFGDKGELYIQSGGNTNAGVPGQISGSGIQKEGVLSSATLVAHLGRSNFDGTITYSADDDGDQTGGLDVEVFAPGQRNPYDIVMHSNGRLYGTDNGPNLGYGDISLGCNGESRPDTREQDKLLLLEQGKYYGHANHKRGASDSRQCVWYSGTASSTAEYTAAIVELPASSNGIFEWTSNHFGGQLRGNLITSHYKDEINRAILNASGDGVVPESNPVIPMLDKEAAESLSITQAPSGEIITARYLDHKVWFHRPDEPATSALLVLNVWPVRGGEAGGNTLSVYGKNLNKNGGNPSITVGGADCPVTMVKEFRVACTLPLGSLGTVDIILTAGGETSVFPQGYRYIKGRP